MRAIDANGVVSWTRASESRLHACNPRALALQDLDLGKLALVLVSERRDLAPAAGPAAGA